MKKIGLLFLVIVVALVTVITFHARKITSLQAEVTSLQADLRNERETSNKMAAKMATIMNVMDVVSPTNTTYRHVNVIPPGLLNASAPLKIDAFLSDDHLLDTIIPNADGTATVIKRELKQNANGSFHYESTGEKKIIRLDNIPWLKWKPEHFGSR